MAYEQKEGDIAVFKVKEKTNERGPDWTGKVLINGQEMQVSFWQKSETMLAGQVKEKFKPNYSEARQAVEKTSGPANDPSDDIPW
jgi:hypothetical protein